MIKKTLYYSFLMFMVLIVLPLLIVKSCDITNENGVSKNGKLQLKIKVYIASQKKVVEMPLEEYVKGVVAAEMPAEFGMEALKAQAVAARTYAIGRMEKIFTSKEDVHDGADVCTDSGHCQAWESKKDAMKGWGFFKGLKYWSKIERAVKETENIVIEYNQKVINPLFHSNSGGKTEDAEDVWDGVEVPYLKSVISRGEENNADYENYILISKKDFCSKFKEKYPNIKLTQKEPLKDLKIINYTVGGRVKTIKFGNLTLKGTEFRKLFSLKSAKFKIEQKDKDTLKITTLGNGHGVGMSQWGANYLSKNGGSYEEIIKYYYKGVELNTIKNP